MKLFQNIVIPGYIEGLDYNSHIPICTSVGHWLGKLFNNMSSLNIFQNLVDTPAFFLKGWNIPGTPAKVIMSGRGGSQSIHM